MSVPVLFQNMPPLSPEEYSELEASIREHGIQVPIIVDESGVVVDGHHRQKIAEHLGIDCPKRVLSSKSDSEKRTLALSLNVHRRHLNREQKRALIAESLKADPQLPDNTHAKRTGASWATVNAVRSDLEKSSQIENFSERIDPRTGNASQPATRRTTEIHSGAGFVNPGEEIELTSTTTVDLDTGDVIEERPYAHPEPAAPPKPRAEPITRQFTSAISDLNRVLDRLHRVSNDNNFAPNKTQVATLHGNDLARAISELQDLADALH